MLALSLFGCLVNTALYERRVQELSDADSDGFENPAEGGNDCDDHDARVYPGAVDVPYDGVDQDCSGTDLVDVDGDGFEHGDDCDDDDAGVYPGAPDACYDGIDQDCAGNDDFDCDGDGARVDSTTGGTDCDDGDATVYPGADDACYDGIDQDCAGNDDFDCDADGFTEDDGDCDDDDAGRYPDAEEGWTDLGSDNDCDGAIDDPVTASLADAGVILDPPADYGYFGANLGTAADVDGDGIDEIFVSAPYASPDVPYQGAVFVVGGADLAGHVVLSADADHLLAPDTYTFLAGHGTSHLAGLSGEFLVVGSGAAAGGDGMAWLVATDSVVGAGRVSPADVAVASFSGGTSDYAGSGATTGRDIDGDGLDDLLLDAAGTGRILGFSSPGSGAHDADDADWVWTPSRAGGYLVARVPGDVDGDGIDDLGLSQGPDAGESVGAALYAGGAGLAGGEFGVGGVTFFTGTPTLDTMAQTASGDALVVLMFQASLFVGVAPGGTYDPLVDADYQLFRTPDEAAFSGALWVPWLGDAREALVLPAYAYPEGTQTGECVVWGAGNFGGEDFSADQPLRLRGEQPGDRACTALAAAPDLNADGWGDLLVGAPLVDATEPDSGRVYVQFNP